MPENPSLTTDLTGQGGKLVKVKSDESGFEFVVGGAGGGDLLAANNLSDLANTATARTNLGLGNVNNTSDANKPISTATQTALDGKAASSHTHTIANVTGLQTALDGKQAAGSYAASVHSHSISDVTGLQTALDGKQAAGSYAASSHAHAISDITNLQTSLDSKASSTHSHAISDVTNLQTSLNAKQDSLTNGYGLSGATTKAVGLTTASAFATATTTVSTATYMDITGCSISLAAGTWIIYAHIIASAANAIIQCFGAITDGANAVISESANSRPASGTASLNSPISMSWFAIVSPATTTTYKLRGARGLTTHTGSWVAMDGNGVNTTNHASNNTDKGTGIFAIRIA